MRKNGGKRGGKEKKSGEVRKGTKNLPSAVRGSHEKNGNPEGE